MKFKKKPKRTLCPDCKTGRESYTIDEKSPVCPYFECYNGYSCTFFTPMDTKKKKSFFLMFFSK